LSTDAHQTYKGVAGIVFHTIVSMRKPLLIVAFVFLVAMDMRAIIELWERLYLHRRWGAIERLTMGDTLYWVTWALMILFDLGVLWLTIRVGRRLRSPKSATP
jgi:hypothetical protein